MSKNELESKILKRIKDQVPLFCPTVIWLDRLQSGVMFDGRNYVRLCKAGTPDLYAIIDKDGGHMVFIECKSAKGAQSLNQRKFEALIGHLTRIHYILARDVKTVVNYINHL